MHVKPTDSHTWLSTSTSSCHPPNAFRGVKEQIKTLKSHLCVRDYKAHTMQSAIDKINKKTFETLLQYMYKEKKRQ